jgi:hypothetical protein
MVRRWHTPEQIIGKLRGADRLLAGGGCRRGCPALGGVRADLSPVAEPVRRHEGEGCQAAQGSRAGESGAQADRAGQGAGEPRPSHRGRKELRMPGHRAPGIDVRRVYEDDPDGNGYGCWSTASGRAGSRRKRRRWTNGPVMPRRAQSCAAGTATIARSSISSPGATARSCHAHRRRLRSRACAASLGTGTSRF